MANSNNQIEKSYSITVYENNGDKSHSGRMDYEQAAKLVKSLKKEKVEFMVWDFAANSDATYKF